ncbi:MAG: hypothetical protein US53_C0069G0004 [Candidatus Woesebacteria bacterium GW2011_GWA1_37_7]|uniref:Helix-turn-helix domain-containing protein n=1 Tax=Candidatus Woesebacteria bacterium GW2011_GWA1_37_7 TaxID=1618545 RepID=A0A0G0GY11_9BACT|nr:MAG: hypothetical protein US53_C0069G0004 [Candidatus Woesebacteria bacterium GW2011_GWA1_37_7]
MKKYYTVKETSQLLGVSTNTVYSYLQEGKLEAKRIMLIFIKPQLTTRPIMDIL